MRDDEYTWRDMVREVVDNLSEVPKYFLPLFAISIALMIVFVLFAAS